MNTYVETSIFKHAPINANEHVYVDKNKNLVLCRIYFMRFLIVSLYSIIAGYLSQENDQNSQLAKSRLFALDRVATSDFYTAVIL